MTERLTNSLNETTHVVIKLGTGALTPHFIDGEEPAAFFEELALQIKKLRALGKKVMVVSSGAVGLGRKLMTDGGQGNLIKGNQTSLQEKQALASVGQGYLVDCYRRAFGKHQISVAQILVSKEDFERAGHYRNLQNTLDQLLEWGTVPIINENDAVATDELRYGDNDRISAFMACMYARTLLIMLTTVDGFYVDGEKVDHLEEVTEAHLGKAGEAGVEGSGGMQTKVKTAQSLLEMGQIVNIASAVDLSVIERISSGAQVGSWFFHPGRQPTTDDKERWRSLKRSERWWTNVVEAMAKGFKSLAR